VNVDNLRNEIRLRPAHFLAVFKRKNNKSPPSVFYNNPGTFSTRFVIRLQNLFFASRIALLCSVDHRQSRNFGIMPHIDGYNAYPMVWAVDPIRRAKSSIGVPFLHISAFSVPKISIMAGVISINGKNLFDSIHFGNILGYFLRTLSTKNQFPILIGTSRKVCNIELG
jgi:hypothetical protein